MGIVRSALGVEQWKSIEGFPDYEVSDQGNVRSNRGESDRKRLKQYTNESDTYLVVSLYADDRKGKRQRLVHSLVMQHFQPEKWEEYMTSDLEINHKDGDPKNNRLENLEYLTPEENVEMRDQKDDSFPVEEAPF